LLPVDMNEPLDNVYELASEFGRRTGWLELWRLVGGGGGGGGGGADRDGGWANGEDA
jgi:hypothetical protein